MSVEPSSFSVHGSLRQSLPPLNATILPPTRGPVIFPESSRQPLQPAVSESPRPTSAKLGNVATTKESERRLQNGKSPHFQAAEEATETEAGSITPSEEPASSVLDSQPVSKPSNIFVKPSTSSNPFAKASNSSNPSIIKQSGLSGGEVSLLDSLKNMQKKNTENVQKMSETDGKKKRKVKSSADKPIRPQKAAKEAS